MATLKADIFADGQVLENARHHLAGRTHAVGYILLGQFLRDIERAVTALFRQIHQHIGHAAIDVLQRETLHIGGELAHALCQIAHQLAADIGVLIQYAVEIFLVDNTEGTLLHGAHRSRAGGVIQQRQLAKIIPGALGVHNELLAILVAAVDLDLAALNHEQRIGGVILMNYHRILGKRATGTAGGQRLQFFL